MYAVCVSRYVSWQMVPVAPCDSAEGFGFVDACVVSTVKGFISMAAVTLTTISESLDTRCTSLVVWIGRVGMQH